MNTFKVINLYKFSWNSERGKGEVGIHVLSSEVSEAGCVCLCVCVCV